LSPHLSVQTLSGRIENRNLALGPEIVAASAEDSMLEDMVDIPEEAIMVVEEVTKTPLAVKFTLETFDY
jgi:hypothetical protein